MKLDHVLLAVPGRSATGPALPGSDGLESYEGGRHPLWGTANTIVPLREAYLELIRVVDERAAEASTFGRWVAAAAREGGAPLGWAVRPRDLEATAARLGLEIAEGSRTTPTGAVVAWRMAGVDQAVRTSYLPFFVEWRDPAMFPGRAEGCEFYVERLELEGDPAKLESWLGEHSLPIEVREGSRGVTAIVLASPRGEVILGRG